GSGCRHESTAGPLKTGEAVMWFSLVLGCLNSGRSPTRVGPGRRCRPRVEALEQRLLPSFTPAAPVPVGTSPRSVAVAAFNADGKPDLATADSLSTSGTVSIYLGTGQGGFAAFGVVFVGPSPTFAAVGDFNGDGKPDLAVANQGSDFVRIRLGDGPGGFISLPAVHLGVQTPPGAGGALDRGPH